MSEFSARQFAAGSLTGLRACLVDDMGRLRSPSRPHLWLPGENTAVCRPEVHPSMWHSAAIFPAQIAPLFVQAPPKHRPAPMDCGCGFYAYTDGTNDYHKPDATVAVIVEGWGVCTVGDRGFRAEKARIVAMILPKPTGPRWYRQLAAWVHRTNLQGVAAGLGFFVTAQPLIWLGVMPLPISLLLSLLGFLLLVLAASAIRGNTPGRERRHELLRRAYPDVPVYRSARAAVRSHPLTRPESRLPDPSDPDFWTRGPRP